MLRSQHHNHRFLRPNKILYIILAWLLISNLDCLSQQRTLGTSFPLKDQLPRDISYAELAHELFKNTDDTLKYVNVHFVNDFSDGGEELFISEYVTNSLAKINGGFKNYLLNKNITKDSLGFYRSSRKFIWFETCKFDSDIRFSNIAFQGTVVFNNNDFPTPTGDFAGFNGQSFGGAILFDSCRSTGEIVINDQKNHVYKLFCKLNNSIFSGFYGSLINSQIQIKNSHFKNDFYLQAGGASSVVKISTTYFELCPSNIQSIRSFFPVPPGQDIRILESNSSESITIEDSDFKYSSNQFLDIWLDAKNITLHNNNFNSNVNLRFLESSIDLWKNRFNDKLEFSFLSIDKDSYIDTNSLRGLDFGTWNQGQYYEALNKEQVEDSYEFNMYLRTYKKLYDHFKEVGDIQSANLAYVKIQELQARYVSSEYEKYPSFKNFFRLNLNRLLKFYTNYGTDPAKAIVISFYAILLFAVFYFFFPSDWDVTGKSILIQNFKEFRKRNNKGFVRTFIALMVRFLINSINAITLSLNAFTTLGFGNIPTHGLARYICVIQGFIGWFLLTIFTVALINQALF